MKCHNKLKNHTFPQKYRHCKEEKFTDHHKIILDSTVILWVSGFTFLWSILSDLMEVLKWFGPPFGLKISKIRGNFLIRSFFFGEIKYLNEKRRRIFKNTSFLSFRNYYKYQLAQRLDYWSYHIISLGFTFLTFSKSSHRR